MTLEWFYVYMYIFVSSSFSTLCCYDSFPSVAKILSQSNIPTVTFYNKLVVLYCLFSSLLKWLLTFFSSLYSEKFEFLVVALRSGDPLLGTYCIRLYFTALYSIFLCFNPSLFPMMHDLTWSGSDGLSLTFYPRGDNSVTTRPEMYMCMFSVICSGILYVLVFVIFFCCVCCEKGTFHK